MSIPALLPAAGEPSPAAPAEALPGPVPPLPAGGLVRCRMRTHRAGLGLRAGDVVLCAPYEPAALGMVVVVRREAGGPGPGALISTAEVERLDPVPSS